MGQDGRLALAPAVLDELEQELERVAAPGWTRGPREASDGRANGDVGSTEPAGTASTTTLSRPAGTAYIGGMLSLR